MNQVVLKRFLRTLVAAFIAGVSTQLATGTSISSLEDLKKFGISLLMAGIAGVIMAVDKLIRYEDVSPAPSN
jgi:hypothetical protein